MGVREKIIDQNKFDLYEVDVSEWGDIGEPLYVNTLSCQEAEAFELSCRSDDGQPQDFKAHIVSVALVTGERERVFADGDIHIVRNLNARVINRVADLALKVNGYTDSDLEELGKNLNGTTSNGSG